MFSFRLIIIVKQHIVCSKYEKTYILFIKFCKFNTKFCNKHKKKTIKNTCNDKSFI